MATYKAAALLLLATFAFGAYANDLILSFKVVDCYGNGVKDVVITLNGCVDPVDNKGMPFTAVTDGNGTAVFAPSNTNPNGFVRYCYGSATGYCSWTAVGAAGKVYDSVMKTLQRQTASGTYNVTAREASNCACNGSDYCAPTIYYDAQQTTLDTIDPIVINEQNCPGTPPCPPPTESCPHQCQFDVSVTRDNNLWDGIQPVQYTETVTGICSSNLKLTESCGEKPERVCPRGYINSRQPCKSGKDCGVCCVAQTSLCAAKQGGRCNQYGGQCMCREIKDGATCKTLTFPDIIKSWQKKNRNPKCDDWGNMLNWSGSKIDWSRWNKGNWHGNRRLQTIGSYSWDWSSYLYDGCQDNLCGAVAAKGGFTAACCAHYA